MDRALCRRALACLVAAAAPRVALACPPGEPAIVEAFAPESASAANPRPYEGPVEVPAPPPAIEGPPPPPPPPQPRFAVAVDVTPAVMLELGAQTSAAFAGSLLLARRKVDDRGLRFVGYLGEFVGSTRGLWTTRQLVAIGGLAGRRERFFYQYGLGLAYLSDHGAHFWGGALKLRFGFTPHGGRVARRTRAIFSLDFTEAAMIPAPFELRVLWNVTIGLSVTVALL
ncbi:MAG: hypothetical protein KC636_38430 [Myxococcales bacterium]|nr:hypothetical protein [Myxococcales bacterium]